MQKNIHYEIGMGIEIRDWTRDVFYKKEFANTERITIAILLFNLELDHHDAIISLTEQKNGASAFSLTRSLLEAYLRGGWLYLVADEKEI